MEREEYVERLTGFIVPAGDKEARAALTLDGIYEGSSGSIRRMLQVAYRRGVRRGASLAWSARQPISLHSAEKEGG